MAPRQYRNFDLVIETGDEGFDVRVVDSPAGEAHGTFQMPFGPHELENFILKMGARRGVRRAGPGPRTAAQAFGQTLYRAVFSSDVEYALRQSLQDCQGRDEGLRVRLRLHKAPELMDLPWEYLHSTALGRPLALSVDTPVVRYMDMGLPVEALEVAPPLRILMVASSPSDIEQLDTDRELQNLRDATADLVRDGRIEVHALASPTVADLQHQLRKEAFHILHFMGHGIFDEATGIGMLAFEDDEGRARPVAGADLGMMLHDHRGLQMVVLNACEGARTSVHDPLGGVAQSLARQGIPAVVAMQFEISDAAAKRFSHELYLAIADGYPVDAAVSEARKALYLQDRATEWGTPVLHLRAADGHIFDLVAPPQPAAVPELMHEVEERSDDDPAEQISAIGILQRILAIDPDNQVAADQLAQLQDRARRPRPDADTPAGPEPGTGAPTDPEAGQGGDASGPGSTPGSTPTAEPVAPKPVAPEPVAPEPVASEPARRPGAATGQGMEPPRPIQAASPPDATTPIEPVRSSSPSGPAAPPVPPPVPVRRGSDKKGRTKPRPEPPPVPIEDGGRTPWGKRIALAAVGVVAVLFGLGVLGALLEDPDDPPTEGPTIDPTFGPTDGPTRSGDPFAWLDELPDNAWVATTVAAPLVIDGDFGDWPDDVVVIDMDNVVHGEFEDVGGQGAVTWDDDVLYVGASVEDPFVEQAWHFEPSQLWRGDSVSFEFAFDPPDDPAAIVADGDLHVLLGPDDGAGEGVLPAVNPASGGVFRAGGVEPVIALASVLTDTGYAIEAAIPWVVFGFVPEVGESVAFNLNISNGDGAGDFSSMVSSTEGRTSANQPRTACWGRLLMWTDDLGTEPAPEELPRPSDAVPC